MSMPESIINSPTGQGQQNGADENSLPPLSILNVDTSGPPLSNFDSNDPEIMHRRREIEVSDDIAGIILRPSQLPPTRETVPNLHPLLAPGKVWREFHGAHTSFLVKNEGQGLFAPTQQFNIHFSTDSGDYETVAVSTLDETMTVTMLMAIIMENVGARRIARMDRDAEYALRMGMSPSAAPGFMRITEGGVCFWSGFCQTNEKIWELNIF